jgi:hypothetical protein
LIFEAITTNRTKKTVFEQTTNDKRQTTNDRGISNNEYSEKDQTIFLFQLFWED